MARIAQETKIRQHYLSALEEEDFESLPARVYAIGFVASYARFLKLDADRLIGEFKDLAYSSEAAEPIPPEPDLGKKWGFPIRNAVAALVFLAMALWLGSYVADYISGRAVARLPQTEQPAGRSPDNQAVTDGLTLVIKAKQRTWVQITADGIVQYSGIMEAGGVKSFIAHDRLDMRTGNAGGIQLQLNGDVLPPLGAPGQVADKTFTSSGSNSNPPVVDSTNPIIPAASALQLEVRATQRSWVQVSADGDQVYSQNMVAGEIRYFTAVELIELKTGNAGGIDLSLNGQPVEPLGSPGQIAQKRFQVSGHGE